ncbi:uncharacterized protein LOC135686151 [Rhopilema esculentum]|uniref:uncharacterized protein LOC135686151 n=1 Tax=Rhopilema esculentum TaxID=499914 RepID=UPI0031D986D6
MVIPYSNLMIKGRVDKQRCKPPECTGICIDHNSNPMSESGQSEAKSLHFDNKLFASNGEAAREFLRVPLDGIAGDSNSGSLTDGRDELNIKRSSTNSKDFTAEQDNHKIIGNSNRESSCSVESSGSNILEPKLVPGENYMSGNKHSKSKQLMKLTRGLKFSKGSQNAANQGQSSPSNENENKDSKMGVSLGISKSKKISVSGPPGKKPQESKVRLFNRKRRNRNKLVANAGNSLWRPLTDCSWISASGRAFTLKKTSLSSLCDAERDALRQIVIQKLQDYQLGCNISPPKDGNSARRTWKQRLFLGRKDKDAKEQRTHFGIPIAQVIANDAEAAEELSSRSDTTSTGRRSIVRQEEITKEDPDSLSFNEDDLNTRRSSLPNSYAPLLRSNSFDLEEDNGLDLLNADNLQECHERTTTILRRESQRRRQANNHRRSRLLDALTLSSSSASYISIIDRDDELKPPGPQVPKIVLILIEYIEQHGLSVLGIFRTGGLRKRVRHMREELERGNISIIHSEETNPQDVAALFKEFFRDLPDPLLTRELYTPFLATRKLTDPQQRQAALQLLTGLLPVPNRDTLKALLSCLSKVAAHSQDYVDADGNTIPGNKMDSRNLATLIGPNILHRVKANSSMQTFSPEESLRFAEENNKMIDVVKDMIENHDTLFQVSAQLHDEVLKMLLDTEPETVDYVLRKKASRVSQIEFPDDIQEELSKVPENAHAHPKRSMTLGSTPRPKINSRYSDEGSYIRDSLRIKTSPQSTTRLRKTSTPDRPGSTRSVLSTTSEPDRFSYRKSNSSFQSAASSNRRSQSESADIPEDEIASLAVNRASYRDSGLSMGRNSQRFSGVEETRRKINALETVPSPTLSGSGFPSKSSTPYSSPSGTPILERVEKVEQSQVKLRDRESRESRDSAYASGRFQRKGGLPHHGLQGIFSLGEEDLSPDASQCSPTSPVFLSEILNEPAFNNNFKKGSSESRKISLPAKMITDLKEKENQDRHSLPRSISEVAESKQRKLLLTWEEATWPHWDPNATEQEMPDHETIL